MNFENPQFYEGFCISVRKTVEFSATAWYD